MGIGSGGDGDGDGSPTPIDPDDDHEDEKDENETKMDEKYIQDINAADYNTSNQGQTRMNTTKSFSKQKSLSRQKSGTFGGLFKIGTQTPKEPNNHTSPVRKQVSKSRSRSRSPMNKSPKSSPLKAPSTPVFAALTSYNKSTSSGWDSRDKHNMVKQSIHSYIFHDDGSIYIRIELPPKLPMSTLLNDYDNLIDQMLGLYKKYISENSIHEVNIGYESRRKLKEFFEIKLSQKQRDVDLESFVFNVLDVAAKEILLLMIDSFRRFQTGHVGQSFFSKYKSRISRGNSMKMPSNDDYGKGNITDTDTNNGTKLKKDNTNDNNKVSTLPVLRNMTSYNKLMQVYGKSIDE